MLSISTNILKTNTRIYRMFCSSFRSLNSLFCCINLVKKLTKDFNDRLRSRVFFNFELKHPSARVCRHFKTNTVHLIDCGFNKRKLHLISSFIIQIWSRRMELRHQRDQESFRRKALKYCQLSLELTLTLKVLRFLRIYRPCF